MESNFKTRCRSSFRRVSGAALLFWLLAAVPPTAVQASLSASDRDINWGAAEVHFPQNKQNEPAMATNPTDASNSVSGANDQLHEPDCTVDPSTGGSNCFPSFFDNGVAIYTTTNGGASWQRREAPWTQEGLFSVADPAAAFGPKPNGSSGFSYLNGARAYFANMVARTGGFNLPLITVTSSDDKGATWSNPVVVTNRINPIAQFNDKVALWADNNPSSPYFGNVYVAWTLFTSAQTFPQGRGGDTILFTRSTDGGATWNVPVTLSPGNNNPQAFGGRQGAVIRTDREGRVIVGWLDSDRRQPAMVERVSSDGGQRFGRTTVIGPALEGPSLPGSSFDNSDFLSLDTDQTSDALYAAWVDYSPTSATTGHGVITIARSDDHGQSWQHVGTVDVPGRTAFQPSLAVARQGAAPTASAAHAPLVLGFSALRDVPAGTLPTTGAVDYLPFVAASSDGGASWSAPTTPAGAAPSDPAASGADRLNNLAVQFVGDYSSLSGAPDGKTFYFAYTSAQEGSTCPAVDAYRSGTGPAPNIYTSCTPTFGNTDIHVATVTNSP